MRITVMNAYFEPEITLYPFDRGLVPGLGFVWDEITVITGIASRGSPMKKLE